MFGRTSQVYWVAKFAYVDHLNDDGRPFWVARRPPGTHALPPTTGGQKVTDHPLPDAVAAYWDAHANTFDEEADHGLTDPLIRGAWHAKLCAWLPEPPAAIADLGCGTGSLSVLLAEQGHRVTGIDLSHSMVANAQAKAAAAGVDAEFA